MNGVFTITPLTGLFRILIKISLPYLALSEQTYPIPIPFLSVGERVPEVTDPII